MRLTVVLATLALSFIAPVFVTAADAARPGTAQAASHDTSCRRKRAKKADDDSKPKKKDKEGKKPYGFEL
jgi:hypothetical protein